MLGSTLSFTRGISRRAVTAAEILVVVVAMGTISLGTSSLVSGAANGAEAGVGFANAALATNFISQYSAVGNSTLGGVAVPTTTDFTAAQLTSIFSALNAGVSYSMPGTSSYVTLRLSPPEMNPGAYVGAYKNGQYVIAYNGGGQP